MKYRLKLILVTFILLALAMGCSNDQDKKLSHFNKGNQYFEAQEYKKAEIEFKNAIQIDSQYTEALVKLGDTMMKLGQGRQAFSTYSQVEKISPDNIAALTNLAKLYFLGKKVDEAEIRIEKILAQDNKNIDALFLKAQVLIQQKKIDAAEDLFETILEIQNTHIASLQGLARLKSFQKKFEQAEDLLLKAVEASPDSDQPRLVLVSFYMSRKDLAKAEEQLKLMARNNPDNADHQIVLGNFYLRTQKQALAEDAYKKAIEIAPDTVKPYIHLAKFYEAVGKQEKALALFEKAVTIDPEDISAKMTLAQFQYKTNDVDAAQKLVADILEQRPKFSPARLLQSEIFVSKKEFETALSLLNGLEKEEPNSPMVHYFKGVCHLGLGDINQAAESVSKAVELKPDLIKPRLLLADIYLRQRSFQLAVELTSKILETNDAIYPALMIRANSQMGLGKYKEAEQDYTKLINTDPNNPAGYYRLAYLLSAQKQYEKAEEQLAKAHSINKELIDVFSLRVRNSTLLKNFEQAHNLCRAQLEIAKDKKRNLAIVYNVQGSVYLVEKNPEMASASFQKAIDVDPDYLRSYGSLAQIFIAQKNLTSAISQYETILEKNPGIVSPHMMLGTLSEMQENYSVAEEHYRKALEIDPKFAPAANNLAYHLAERTDKFDDALKFARIAKEQLPDDPGVMDTIGWAYYRKGLYGNAVDEFTESLKSIPENPIVHYHLGLAYHKKGNIELAKKELSTALELNNKFPGADEAQMLLKSL